jgi:hypothetical protein
MSALSPGGRLAASDRNKAEILSRKDSSLVVDYSGETFEIPADAADLR